MSATFEAAALVALYVVANLTIAPDDPGLVGVAPHPTLFIVVLIAARYGFAAAMISAALAAAAYAVLAATMADVPTYLHLVSAPYSTPVALLIPTAAIVGGVVQGHLNRLRVAEGQRDDTLRENRELRDEQAALRDVNVELAGKVVGASSTLPALYRYAKALNVADVDEIYQGLCGLLQEVVRAEQVAVWTVTSHGLALAVSDGYPPGTSAAAPPVPGRYDAFFDQRGVLALHDVPEEKRDPGLPFLIGTIRRGQSGEVVAYLTVDSLPLERYTQETVRLFAIVIDWASTSVGNAVASPQVDTARPDRTRGVGGEPEAAGAQASPARLGDLDDATELNAGPPTFGLSERPSGTSVPESLPGVSSQRRHPAGVEPGLRRLFDSADQLLSARRSARQTASAEAPAMRAEVARASEENRPLGRLLGEIAQYLEQQDREERRS